MARESGSIEVICGSMFSGKSEELIRRLRRAIIARQRVQAFKPEIDDRYRPDDIVAHDARRIECTKVRTAGEILAAVGRHEGRGHRRGPVPRRRPGRGLRRVSPTGASG